MTIEKILKKYKTELPEIFTNSEKLIYIKNQGFTIDKFDLFFENINNTIKELERIKGQKIDKNYNKEIFNEFIQNFKNGSISEKEQLIQTIINETNEIVSDLYSEIVLWFYR